MTSGRLHHLLERSAERWPERLAVVDPAAGAELTYRELDGLANRLRDDLLARGVGPRDRVAVFGKSIPALGAIFAALKAGAAYVPIDAAAPVARSAAILRDCGVQVVFAPPGIGAPLRQASVAPGARPAVTDRLAESGAELEIWSGPGPAVSGDEAPPADLAYLLYTSGSTGMPKGVMHTHASALSFVDWCSSVFAPTERDRFSSHAPFHFDLSILDIFVPIKHGGAIVLIGEDAGKHPPGLAELIARSEISVWYSTPSVLRLLVEYGRLSRHDYPSLRAVLFAGEVFPVPHLRRLMEYWPKPRYYNLYGPTETNVCTYHVLPATAGAADRVEPFPIGKACSGDRVRVVDEQGRDVAAGAEGELLVAGGSVMTGYWNDAERTAAAFLTAADGVAWYRTGDLVRLDDADDLVYVGRRDRMIKRRGYRIEPGEIEAVLYRHPEIVEAAVVALAPAAAAGDVIIEAHLSTSAGQPLPTLEFKRWCADNLARYMIPDRFTYRRSLPKTSTDKIDYQALQQRP